MCACECERIPFHLLQECFLRICDSQVLFWVAGVRNVFLEASEKRDALAHGLEEIEVPLANTRDSGGLSPGFGLFRSFHFNTFCICFTSVKPLAREWLQTLYCTVYSM